MYKNQAVDVDEYKSIGALGVFTALVQSEVNHIWKAAIFNEIILT